MREEKLVRRGFRVTGRVQGVYYRAWTRGVANEMGLSGAVRNRLDGSVEAHVIGTPASVSQFEARLWEGPSAAVVDGVEAIEFTGQVPEGSFQILATI